VGSRQPIRVPFVQLPFWGYTTLKSTSFASKND
jgi:hypothetical protein